MTAATKKHLHERNCDSNSSKKHHHKVMSKENGVSHICDNDTTKTIPKLRIEILKKRSYLPNNLFRFQKNKKRNKQEIYGYNDILKAIQGEYLCSGAALG
jgi:hypothetical protein